MKCSYLRPVSVLLAAVVVSGCASSGVKNPGGVDVRQMGADERGFVAGTGIESQDIVAVGDEMARAILGTPAIASAPTPPIVMLKAIENETRFPINKDIFLQEIMSRLIENSAGKVRFLDRDPAVDAELNLQRSGAVGANKDVSVNKKMGYDYILKGKLIGQTTRTSNGTSDYVLFTFDLVDIRTTEIIWQKSHRIKKQGQDDAVYR